MEPDLHEDVREVDEHGRRWLVCDACGAQWDDHGEMISEGDESCLRNLEREENRAGRSHVSFESLSSSDKDALRSVYLESNRRAGLHTSEKHRDEDLRLDFLYPVDHTGRLVSGDWIRKPRDKGNRAGRLLTFADVPVGATFWFTGARRTTRGATFKRDLSRAYVKVDDRRYRDVDDPEGRFVYTETRRDSGVSTSPPSSNRARSSSIDFDSFFDAYLQAAFWSSTDESDEGGGEPMDANYGPGDLAKADLAEMRRDAREFATQNAELIRGREAQAGHDFWLTRNGHGAGFWDGDWPEPAASILTKASEVFGEQHLYLADPTNPAKRGRQKVYVYPPPAARKHTLKMRAERAARAKKAG